MSSWIFEEYFSDCFADFPAIEKIDFDKNKFSTLKSFQFGGIGNTGVTIYLRNNSISSIEPDAFESKRILYAS